MKYQAYLKDVEGNLLERNKRKGHQGRNRRSEVFMYNKKLHTKRAKRLAKNNP